MLNLSVRTLGKLFLCDIFSTLLWPDREVSVFRRPICSSLSVLDGQLRSLLSFRPVTTRAVRLFITALEPPLDQSRAVVTVDQVDLVYPNRRRDRFFACQAIRSL